MTEELDSTRAMNPECTHLWMFLREVLVAPVYQSGDTAEDLARKSSAYDLFFCQLCLTQKRIKR